MKHSKSLLIIVLSAIITYILSFSVITASAKAVDIDGDGSIGISDVTEIQKVIAGLKTPSDNFYEIADVNEDNSVNINDVTYIQKYIAGMIDEENEQEPTNVSLSLTSITLKVGNSVTISGSTDLSSYSKGFEWSSSNPFVATIDETTSDSTTISAMAQGTADITIKTSNGKIAVCKVTVSGSDVKCLDVSTWQGYDVDFEKVKESGIDYVILRAGYGKETYQKDDTFEINYKKAKEAGLKVGAYWFSYSMSPDEAVEEANACLYCINGKQLDMPVYYDMEYIPAINQLDSSEYTNMAVNFCNTIRDAGYKSGVYASASVFDYPLNFDTIRPNYSVWNAEWSSFRTVDCDVWQFTSEGSVDGIYGNVDLSYIFNLNVVG